MSYLRHWKLLRSPFSISGNGRGMFTGGTIEEAIARCEFLIGQNKQLGLILGPSGVGKTVFVEHFCRSRNPQNPREGLYRVDLRCADAASIPSRILSGLGLDEDAQDSRLHGSHIGWSRIHDHLFARSAIGHRTVLLLDNVYDVAEEVFQAISQLWSSRTHWSMLLTVDDEAIVDLPRWILDQCELKIDLPRWDLGQSAEYFDFAISQAGSREDIFDGQAITRIQELSDGIPRKITQIAELALVAGAVRKSPRVSADLVDQVCDEFTVSIGGKFPAIWADQTLNAG